MREKQLKNTQRDDLSLGTPGLIRKDGFITHQIKPLFIGDDPRYPFSFLVIVAPY